MKKFFVIMILATLSYAVNSVAEVKCTLEERKNGKWQNETAFQIKLLSEGYQINNFKVTKGKCYEIYGKNKKGQRVEIYFDPVTGQKIKEEID